MGSVVSVLNTRLFSACRASSVATAAGVGEVAWASVDVPHVFHGLEGQHAGRNRGRCPFMAFEVLTGDFSSEEEGGIGVGELVDGIALRITLNGGDTEETHEQAWSILAACINEIRATSGPRGDEDNLCAIGATQILRAEKDPFGVRRDAILEVVQTYQRDDHGNS